MPGEFSEDEGVNRVANRPVVAAWQWDGRGCQRLKCPERLLLVGQFLWSIGGFGRGGERELPQQQEHGGEQ